MISNCQPPQHAPKSSHPPTASSLFFDFFVYPPLCLWSDMSIGQCACASACVWRSEVNATVSLHLLLVLTQSLICQPVLKSSWPMNFQEFSVSASQKRWGYRQMLLYLILSCFWECKIRCSCLQDQHFTRWVISPDLPHPLFSEKFPLLISAQVQFIPIQPSRYHLPGSDI